MKRVAEVTSEAESLYKLSVAYHNGDGVSRDSKRAFELMQQAANLGSLKAYLALAAHYDYGIGVSRSPKRAFDWYRRAAVAGDADGQYDVAACYYSGLGAPRSYRSAVKWLQRAVKQRVPEAAFLLGCCYEHGRGVKRDSPRAMMLFRLAARSGHPDAHVEIGFHSRDRDPRKAVRWFRKGARLGSAAGQYNLAYCFERGEGVRANFQLASKWYRAAAEQGHEKALRALAALQKRMPLPHR